MCLKYFKTKTKDYLHAYIFKSTSLTENFDTYDY